MEGIGSLRLDGDHGNMLPVIPVQALKDSTQEAGPADRGHDRVRFQAALSNFIDQGTVAPPDEGVIEGMYVRDAIISQAEGMFMSFVPRAAFDDDLGAVGAYVLFRGIGGWWRPPQNTRNSLGNINIRIYGSRHTPVYTPIGTLMGAPNPYSRRSRSSSSTTPLQKIRRPASLKLTGLITRTAESPRRGVVLGASVCLFSGGRATQPQPADDARRHTLRIDIPWAAAGDAYKRLGGGTLVVIGTGKRWRGSARRRSRSNKSQRDRRGGMVRR